MIFLLNQWHIKRETKKNLKAALLIVIHELASNTSTIKSYIDIFLATGGVPKTFRLRDDAYQSVSITLARNLDESIMTPLGSTYGMVVFVDQMMQFIISPKHEDIEQLNGARSDIQTQINELTNILKRHSPKLPKDPTLKMIYKLFLVWIKNKREQRYK